MPKVVTIEQMRAIEREGDASGVSFAAMMDNAGRALADYVLDRLSNGPPTRILVLVGPGNNGGDALVAGRMIAADSPHAVSFYLARPRGDDDPNFVAVRQAGLFIAVAENDSRFRVLKNLISTSDMVIDGILGIGVQLPIKGALADLLKSAGTAIRAARGTSSLPPRYDTPDTPENAAPPRPIVVAVDCPSGLECDTGALDTLTIPADATVTFAALKAGQVLFPGAGACGKLHIADIGLPRKLSSRDAIRTEMPTASAIRTLLPQMPADAHKGTFGKIMIAAGSSNYTGAAVLAAEAAYRAGAGLVTVAAPQIIVPVLAAQLPEATWLLLPHDMGVISEDAAYLLCAELAGYSALLLGPGWGREATTREFLATLLDQGEIAVRHQRIGLAPQKDLSLFTEPSPARALPPLVIDADGLNLLSEITHWWKLIPANTVLTPHPGEMARLTGLTHDQVNAQRLTLPVTKAAEWDCVVVLKGAFTVVAAPDGRSAILPFAEPALATAGTGDVLAGAITSLLGQGCGPFEAATAAGYIHGLAGRVAAERAGNRRSVTARDVLAAIGEAFSRVERAR